MSKSFEDCLFLAIGNTLTREDLENIKTNPEKTTMYISCACMFAQALSELIYTFTDKDAFEKASKEVKSKTEEAVFKEFLQRFNSNIMN